MNGSFISRVPVCGQGLTKYQNSGWLRSEIFILLHGSCVLH